MTKEETLKEQILAEFDEEFKFPDNLALHELFKDFLSSSMDRMGAESLRSQTLARVELIARLIASGFTSEEIKQAFAISDSEAGMRGKASSDMPEEKNLSNCCGAEMYVPYLCSDCKEHCVSIAEEAISDDQREESVASLIQEIEKMKVKINPSKKGDGWNFALDEVIKLIQSRTSDDRGEQSANASVTPKKYLSCPNCGKRRSLMGCENCPAISEERSDSSVAN